MNGEWIPSKQIVELQSPAVSCFTVTTPPRKGCCVSSSSVAPPQSLLCWIFSYFSAGEVLADDGLFRKREAVPAPRGGSVPDGVCESADKTCCSVRFSSSEHIISPVSVLLWEQGNLQVFYQDLPLSIQDGYEKFLSANTVSLQQYQVQPLLQHTCENVTCEMS